MNSVDLAGARISALTIDGQGRIYYADDARGTVGTFDPKTSKVNEVPFARRGATTALLVDSTSTLWVGTSTGEIYSVRGSKGRWYRDLATGGFATLEFAGRRLEVRADPASDAAPIERASREYLRKYQPSPYAQAMVRAEVLPTTLRLEPR